jgi:hypothetical protein
MKAYGGEDGFLTLAVGGDEWSTSHPGRLIPGEGASVFHWIGSWVDPRTTLDDTEKRKFLPLQEFELRPLGRSARNQSLYRLSCPCPRYNLVSILIQLTQRHILY